HEPLGAPRGERTAGGDAGPERLRVREQPLARMHGQSETEPFHLRRIDLTSRTDQLERARPPDERGETDGTAGAGKSTPQRLRQREGRVRGREADVAGEGQLGGARARGAI